MAGHYGPPYVRTLEVLSDAGTNPLLVLSSGIGDDGYDVFVLDAEGKKRFLPGGDGLVIERKAWPDGVYEKVRDALTKDVQDGPPVIAEARRQAVLEKWPKPQ